MNEVSFTKVKLRFSKVRLGKVRLNYVAFSKDSLS